MEKLDIEKKVFDDVMVNKKELTDAFMGPDGQMMALVEAMIKDGKAERKYEPTPEEPESVKIFSLIDWPEFKIKKGDLLIFVDLDKIAELAQMYGDLFMPHTEH